MSTNNIAALNTETKKLRKQKY